MNTENQNKAILRQAMQHAKSDNLERADIFFGKLTPKELNEPHGMSGNSRAEIWQEYKDHRQSWSEANEYLERLLA